MIKLIADCGLPLKITTEWTDNEYTDQDSDGMVSTSAMEEYGKKQAKESNKNKGSGKVDALPKDAIIKE